MTIKIVATYRELDDFAQRNMQTDQKEYMQGHMVRLFEEVVAFRPGLIVELGVGWGCSTFALGKAAAICGARMISIDIKPCKDTVELRKPQNVEFVQADDLKYAKTWSLGPTIDILMIDTEHTYGQVHAEVEAWFHHLKQRCRVIFHDTDGRPECEGVARYLREYLKVDALDVATKFGDWNIRHYQESMGLTILDRETKQEALS